MVAYDAYHEAGRAGGGRQERRAEGEGGESREQRSRARGGIAFHGFHVGWLVGEGKDGPGFYHKIRETPERMQADSALPAETASAILRGNAFPLLFP